MASKPQPERNPSIQCIVCGQWKRLHGKDGNGHTIQRFYPCCGENGQHEHEKPVCDRCCQYGCPYNSDTVFISNEHSIAPDLIPEGVWTARFKGEVIDYHKKEILIRNAKTKGLKYKIN